MGDGVRELDDALDGEDERERSAEPTGEDARESSDPACGLRLLPLVAIVVPSPLARFVFMGTAVICFGASGGLSTLGWKSMIGRKIFSMLYCFAKARPRSRGTHVPTDFDEHRTSDKL